MSKDSLSLISIVVAVYNGAPTIQRCLDSIFSQGYLAKELIVIDGASTDGTLEILKKNKASITYWESKPDRGIYHAWNKSLEHAHGDWICFLGADDYFWASDVLERMASYLVDRERTPMIVYGQLAIMNAANVYLYTVGEPWERTKKRFMSIMAIPHPGTMHHRSLFEKHGQFDEDYRIAGDYEMLLRALRGGGVDDVLFVPDLIVAGMQMGGISSNPEHSILSLKEVRRAHQKWLDGKNGWAWWFEYAKVLTRLLLWKLLGETTARKFLDVIRTCAGKPKYWTRT